MPVRKVGPDSYQWGNSGKVYTGKDAKAKAERQGRAIYASGYREAESYKPPASAVANAKRGLALRKEYGRGGLSPSEAKSQGIDSGVTRARKIASGKVSRHDVRRMSAFNRHRKNYRPEKKMPDGGPTAGTIAWLLWGGTSGVNWAKKKSASMNAESEERCQMPVGASWENKKCGKRLRSNRFIEPRWSNEYGVMMCSDCVSDQSYAKGLGEWVDKYPNRRHDAESEERRGDYMVPADIHRILESAVHLQQLQESHDGSYPEWWKSKLSVVASQLDNLTDVLDYKVDHPEEFDAEDYNSFTEDLDSLIDKYGVLQSYETSYYDNLMEVSFSFQPHDPYFDQVDFDAENWGGDPEGPLAKALARAREKLSQPRKPLRITSLPHPDQKTLKDFESDNWKLLPRDRMGRWRKPVDSESINRLTESLSSDVPSISELLTMYGGDTPTNRFRLYQDLQTLSIAQMDAALPDDSIVEFDETDLSWMTPEEYYQYVLEEPLNLSDDIEDDTQTVEFQDRLVRYTAMTMTPTEVDDLLEQNLKDVVADLFAPDSEDTEAEIAFLLAVKRYQDFSDRYAAESDKKLADLTDEEFREIVYHFRQGGDDCQDNVEEALEGTDWLHSRIDYFDDQGVDFLGRFYDRAFDVVAKLGNTKKDPRLHNRKSLQKHLDHVLGVRTFKSLNREYRNWSAE
jgi:hypothetical protein